jgi:hypothetical protein
VKQKVPVCTSEIRKIFRSWDYALPTDNEDHENV